jgi:hypothetical protein
MSLKGIRGFVMILVLSCLLAGVAGCTGPQLDAWLGHLTDPNNPGNQITAAVESPTGQAMPLPVRLIMEALGVSAAVAYATWQQLKTKGIRGAMQPVVTAVENLSPQIRKEVKAEIEKEMLKAGDYQAKNRQIDQLKAS